MWASRGTRTSSPGRVRVRIATWLAIVPVGNQRPASCPSSAATRSWSRLTVGSSPNWSSPTSARAIASRIAGVGRVTVSERRSMTGPVLIGRSVRRRGVGVGSRRCPPITRSSAATCPTRRGARPRAPPRLPAGPLPPGDRRARPRGAPGPGGRRSGLVLGRRRRRHRRSPGSAGRTRSLDLASGGPDGRAGGSAAAFNHAAASVEPARRGRSGRRGDRLGGRGRRGPPPDERGAARRGRRGRPDAAGAGRPAAGIASGSSCRCSSRRSSRSWRSGGSRRSSPRSSPGYGAPAVAARLGDCEASRADHRRRVPPARLARCR